MKRIQKIAAAFVPMLLLTSIALNAQDNQNEKHIKVVIVDNSGNKIQLDTLIKGDMNSDSIRLKNGETIYLSGPGKPGKSVHKESAETMMLTYSSDDKDSKDKQKKVIVVTGDDDSSKVIEEGNVIIVTGGKNKENSAGKGYTVRTSKEGGSGDKYVYINESSHEGDKKDKMIEFSYSGDDKNNTVEKSKYVIAKDGIVVTVEGNDEAKAKEIIEEVKAVLGVNKEEKTGKESSKESKKKKKE